VQQLSREQKDIGAEQHSAGTRGVVLQQSSPTYGAAIRPPIPQSSRTWRHKDRIYVRTVIADQILGVACLTRGGKTIASRCRHAGPATRRYCTNSLWYKTRHG
jgi:hypothetical protein